jgi:hypothetical protein
MDKRINKLGGAAYKRIRENKQKDFDEVLKKTPKLDTLFAKNRESIPSTSTSFEKPGEYIYTQITHLSFHFLGSNRQ